MHERENYLRNEIRKILSDFETQKDYIIPARRPDRVIINK